jgi:putative polyhydroxyalkanoate system protein
VSGISIRREHKLGLPKARSIARKWAKDAQDRLSLECTIEHGDDADVVHFRRTGVTGRLVVAGDHFDLSAKLGFMLAPFKRTFESEVEKQLDELIEAGAHKEKATASAKKAAAGKK